MPLPSEVSFNDGIIQGKPLGGGTYGCVFEATVFRTGEKVAVKNANLEKSGHVSFVREWCTMSAMRHPNIVMVKDMECDGTVGSITMELMDGTLSSLIFSRRDAIVNERRRMFYCLLDALSYIHSRGVSHRDIKPSNILYKVEAGELVFKISDFGLARPTGGTEFLTRGVCSQPYRPPELFRTVSRTTAYDAKVDVWSMGVVFLEALLGEYAFLCDSDIDTINAIANVLPLKSAPSFAAFRNTAKNPLPEPMGIKDFIESRGADADPLLVDLLEKMLKVDPVERISAAEAMDHPYFDQFARATPHPPTYDVPRRTPLEPALDWVPTSAIDTLGGVCAEIGCSRTTADKALECLRRSKRWDQQGHATSACLLVASAMCDVKPVTARALADAEDLARGLTVCIAKMMRDLEDLRFLFED